MVNATFEQERVKTLQLIQQGIVQYCPLREEEKILAPDGISVLKALGNGSLDAGIREFRKNQEWTKSTRIKSEQLSRTIIISAIGVIVVGFLGTLWMGIKVLLAIDGD